MNKYHDKDEDCTVDLDCCCIICGAEHGEPCPEYGARAYHKENCTLSDAWEGEKS